VRIAKKRVVTGAYLLARVVQKRRVLDSNVRKNVIFANKFCATTMYVRRLNANAVE